MYIHKLKIGDVELSNNIFLAPMAGITDLPFRTICKKYSNPGLIYTEMASAKAIVYKDIRTQKLLKVNKEESPIAIQIFGSEPDIMQEAAKKISEYADIIDINMGCPAPKVVKNGDGSKLLLNTKLIEEIITRVVNNVDIPVTVKIRKGWDKDNVVAVEVAKIAEQAGASSITVHGRTRDEYYSGKVDLEIIKRVKDAVKIPVIGNGDVKTGEDAIKMFEYTGVDGIMVGRANLGNPYKIKEIINYCNMQKEKYFTEPKKKLKIIEEHLNLAIQEKGEYVGIREMRKHICWYIKNLKDSSKVRDIVNRLESKDEVIACLQEYFENL